jgi:hypothetical protein
VNRIVEAYISEINNVKALASNIFDINGHEIKDAQGHTANRDAFIDKLRAIGVSDTALNKVRTMNKAQIDQYIDVLSKEVRNIKGEFKR